MAWPSIQSEQTRECRMGRSASGMSRFGLASQSWKRGISIQCTCKPSVEADSHLNNAAAVADVQYLASKLVREVGDALQMLVLQSQGLTGCESARVEVL